MSLTEAQVSESASSSLQPDPFEFIAGAGGCGIKPRGSGTKKRGPAQTSTVLPQFKHVNRLSFHIYLKHEINMNKHQKVFYFNLGTHHFSSLSSPKLICSPVLFVVKAGRDTFTCMHLADAFIQSDLQWGYSGNTFCFISMCFPWEFNLQPFALLTQCSTTEPQEHRIQLGMRINIQYIAKRIGSPPFNQQVWLF